MISLATLRLIGIGVAALAVVAFVWRWRYLEARVGDLTAELVTATATLTAERENVRKANEVSNAYQADLRRLEGERAKPLSVRLCKPASVPQARAATGPDAAPTGHVGEAPAVDIGPDIGDQLLDYAIAAEANMLQLERLQQWVRER